MDIVTYALLNGKIKDYASNVDEWLEENVDPATGYVLDRSLQMENAAAPADMVGDINDEVGNLKNTLNHKADVIYDTASGDIASFPDGADGLPVKDLTVAIEPVQDTSGGDPSPTHICPISGHTGLNVKVRGKNLVSGRVSGCYINVSGGLTNSDDYDMCYAEVKAGVTYTVTTDEGTNIVCGFFSSLPTRYAVSYDEQRIVQASKTITAPIDGYAAFRTYAGYSTPMLEVGSSASSYEPFASGTTTPISWQSEAGTVYGGTLDVTSGVLTVTDANIASYNGETLPGEWISDRDVYAAGTTPTTGAQVVYKLANPQTYQLTTQEVITTLLGQNNIWTDCGPSTVEYPCDTKLYIERLTAPEEDDMIANQNIASGKYFIVNNNLYLSTTTILAGDPIKPGTNCTLTNLAAALNALNS